MARHIVYLGLGSNMGDRRQAMHVALRLLEQRIGVVTRQSSMVETEPWGFVSTHRFFNMCVQVETELEVKDVLKETQQIEREMGRTVKSVDGVYHDRVIDIDILLFDELSLSCDTLTIPHPRMFERDFVMIPLREIIEEQVLQRMKSI